MVKHQKQLNVKVRGYKLTEEGEKLHDEIIYSAEFINLPGDRKRFWSLTRREDTGTFTNAPITYGKEYQTTEIVEIMEEAIKINRETSSFSNLELNVKESFEE